MPYGGVPISEYAIRFARELGRVSPAFCPGSSMRPAGDGSAAATFCSVAGAPSSDRRRGARQAPTRTAGC